MSNNPEILDCIQYTTLRPWLDTNKPDEKFVSMLGSVKVVNPMFQPSFEIEFIRHFNNKTRYYHKLITNESINYCNQIISLINADNDERLTKYWINDTLNKKLRTRLKDVGKLIKDNDYSLLYINPHNNTYKEDADHKTDTYIIQLLKTALIKVYLDIHEVYKSYIPDSIMEVADFYTQLTFEPIPDESYLKPVIKPIIIEEVKPIEIVGTSLASNVSSFNSFTYIHLNTKPDYINDLYDSLKDKGFIDGTRNKTDFKKLFTGKEITQPIVWTGNISDLHYFIKLIHNINKSVVDLKQHQWEVACKCFVRSDGSQFDRQQLKEQKKPKSTAEILEKIAKQLM